MALYFYDKHYYTTNTTYSNPRKVSRTKVGTDFTNVNGFGIYSGDDAFSRFTSNKGFHFGVYSSSARVGDTVYGAGYTGSTHDSSKLFEYVITKYDAKGYEPRPNEFFPRWEANVYTYAESTRNENKIKGSFIETIKAEDGEYPNNGVKGSYWYVKKGLVNKAPVLNLATPNDKTLYEKDTLPITGDVTDTDSGNTVTAYYAINGGTARAITAYLSEGTKKDFSKTLRFEGGNLYDGTTLIASNLKDGVAQRLTVWAEDNQGGKSTVIERTFYVVPNRAPRLEVTPPTIEGNIDSDTFTVSGTYADDDKNAVIISYRINGSISKEVARGTDGVFDFTVSFAQLKNGNNTISVEAIDSYGAKTSRTIKLNKNKIATPLLQSTVRYLIQPPKGSAQAVLLWLQRDQDLAVTASLHMGMKGEAEAFMLLEPTNTAPLRDNATILEDEFYHEADSAKDHIILQLDMKRSSVESTAAIHLISGVFE